MKKEDLLAFFELDEQFNEEKLNEAYQRKLAELNSKFTALKASLEKKDTIEVQKELKEKLNAITRRIMFSKNIDENTAAKLFVPILRIQDKISQNQMDPELFQFLKNLKLDGTKEDLLLLFLISKNINPQRKDKVKEIESSEEFISLLNNNNLLKR